MQPFNTHEGLVAPIDRANVDTDQVIPKQFLKRIERTGFGQFLFFDWRFEPNGKERPEFLLNQPDYRQASILLARANFGCGSSREHAPWALADFGFKVLIAPSYADIFYNNCFQNGLLPIVLPSDVIDELFSRAKPGYTLRVDLAAQKIEDSEGGRFAFEIDPYRKESLLQGLDEIGRTLTFNAAIDDYEAAHAGY